MFMLHVNNKDADQPAHPCSLISTFIVCCLNSIIPLVSVSKISSLYLVSVASQAGLSLPWSQILKTVRLRFSHDKAQFTPSWLSISLNIPFPFIKMHSQVCNLFQVEVA